MGLDSMVSLNSSIDSTNPSTVSETKKRTPVSVLK
jgi:hypothetical protein